MTTRPATRKPMTRFVRTAMAATSIIGAAFAWCPARVGAALSEQAHSYHRAVCRRRHHRCDRPRAGPTAGGSLRPAGRGREQAGWRRRPGRHRICREVGAGRLHPAGDRGRDLRHGAARLRQAPLRCAQRFRSDHCARYQPAGAGRASVAAGTNRRRARRAREEKPRGDQLRDLRHQLERTSQHYPHRVDDWDEIHAGGTIAAPRPASPT